MCHMGKDFRLPSSSSTETQGVCLFLSLAPNIRYCLSLSKPVVISMDRNITFVEILCGLHTI